MSRVLDVPLAEDFLALEPPLSECSVWGVVRTPALAPEGCRAVLAEVRGREQGHHGLFLGGGAGDDVDWAASLQPLVARVSELLAAPRGRALRFKDAFVVHYRDGDRGHPSHVDCADVTINVCLQLESPAARETKLVFPEQFSDEEPQLVGMCEGWAVVHDGHRLHGSTPQVGGSRHNLVVFADLAAAAAAAGPSRDEFPQFPRLPRHLQRAVAAFLPVPTLGRFCCASRACADTGARDDVWLPHVLFAFDTVEYRALLGDLACRSRAWLPRRDARAWFQTHFVALCEQRSSARFVGMGGKSRAAAPAAGAPAAAYRVPRAADLRPSGLFSVRAPQPPAAAPRGVIVPRRGALSTPPAQPPLQPPPPGAGAPPPPGGEAAARELAERARGSALRVAAYSPADGMVHYWVLRRRGQWLGVFRDPVGWVCSSGLLLVPGSGEPPDWAEFREEFGRSGDVLL